MFRWQTTSTVKFKKSQKNYISPYYLRKEKRKHCAGTWKIISRCTAFELLQFEVGIGLLNFTAGEDTGSFLELLFVERDKNFFWSWKIGKRRSNKIYIHYIIVLLYIYCTGWKEKFVRDYHTWILRFDENKCKEPPTKLTLTFNLQIKISSYILLFAIFKSIIALIVLS